MNKFRWIDVVSRTLLLILFASLLVMTPVRVEAGDDEEWTTMVTTSYLSIYFKADKINDNTYRVINKSVGKKDGDIHTLYSHYDYNCSSGVFTPIKEEYYLNDEFDSTQPVKNMNKLKAVKASCSGNVASNIVNALEEGITNNYVDESCMLAMNQLNGFVSLMNMGYLIKHKYPKLLPKYNAGKAYRIYSDLDMTIELYENVYIETLSSSSKSYKIKASTTTCGKAYIFASKTGKVTEINK